MTGISVGQLIERLLIIQKAEGPETPVVLAAADGSHCWVVCLATDADLQQMDNLPRSALQCAVISGGSYDDRFTRSSPPAAEP